MVVGGRGTTKYFSLSLPAKILIITTAAVYCAVGVGATYWSISGSINDETQSMWIVYKTNQEKDIFIIKFTAISLHHNL